MCPAIDGQHRDTKPRLCRFRYHSRGESQGLPKARTELYCAGMGNAVPIMPPKITGEEGPRPGADDECKVPVLGRTRLQGVAV